MKRSEVREAVNKGLHRAGWEITRYPASNHPAAIRQRLLAAQRIDLVIDVGANIGQYGSRLREYGYTGAIVSLEPVQAVFDQLRVTAQRDGNWTALHTAAGTEKGEISINVGADSVISSALPMTADAEGIIGSGYVATETAPIDRLDSIISRLPGARPFLKTDTQGFERAVLDGAGETFPRLLGIEIELSLSPLYEGQTLWREDIEYLEGAGFKLANLHPGYWNDGTGELLSVDGLFFRSTPAPD